MANRACIAIGPFSHWYVSWWRPARHGLRMHAHVQVRLYLPGLNGLTADDVDEFERPAAATGAASSSGLPAPSEFAWLPGSNASARCRAGQAMRCGYASVHA